MNDFLLEDIPASQAGFGYCLLADTLFAVLQEERQGAFVLGLHGPWGAGKSTLLGAIEQRLKADGKPIVVEFNAWKYQEREALWRALIIHVLEALRRESIGDNAEIGRLERSLYAGFTTRESGSLKVDWGAAATEAMLLAIRIGSANIMPGTAIDRIGDWLNGLFGRETGKSKDDDVGKSMERVGKVLTRAVTEKQVQQVVSIEQFLADFRRLVAMAADRRIYVLIDDLDRCLPESALEVFEAIKLFMDARECVYIVALDREVIRRGLAVRYHEAGIGAVDPDEYVEKTISLSFDLPPLGDTDALNLLCACSIGVNLTDDELRRIVGKLGTNPRRLKRVGRSLSLLFALARATQAPPDAVPWPLREADRSLFLKLSLLSYRNSAVFGQMVRDEGLPTRLQEAATRFENAAQEKGEAKALKDVSSMMEVEHPVVQDAARDAVFLRILSMEPRFSSNSARIVAALRWFGSGISQPNERIKADD